MITVIIVETPTATQHSHQWQCRILGHILQCPPHQVAIARNGKPVCTSHDLAFSVSHTTTHMAVATATHPIGIDIESIHRHIPWAVFNRHRPAPIHQFTPPDWPPSNAPDHHQKIYHWTRWEAHAKLTGMGLRFPIHATCASSVQSLLWQSLCCSVACPAPVTAMSFAVSTGAKMLLNGLVIR